MGQQKTKSKRKRLYSSEFFAKHGRQGGQAGRGDAKRKGARARSAALTPERRSEIARHAALARWGGRRSKVG